MKYVQGFKWVNPSSAVAAHWVVHCPDHPLGKPMEYRLVLDQFKCVALDGRCGRMIKAETLWNALRAGT